MTLSHRCHPQLVRCVVRGSAIAFALGLICLGATASDAVQSTQVRDSLFSYDSTESLRFENTAVGTPLRGVNLFEISYASPGGGSVTGFLAVPAPDLGFFERLWLVAFRRARHHPGIVLMHGMPGSALESMAAWGLSYAQRGAVVVSIDAPWVRRGGGLTYTSRDSVEQVQLIRDLRRAVDVLVGRGDVDPHRIGFSGVSYGAAMGALLFGVEPRLSTAVLRVGGAGLVSRLTDASGGPIEDLARQGPEAQARWLEAMRPIEAVRFIGGGAGRPVLYQAGRSDEFVPTEDSQLLHSAAPDPKTVRWYDAGHALNAEADEDMLEWMSEHLGLASKPAVPAVNKAAEPAVDVRERARAFAGWFVAGQADSIWAATHPDVKKRNPDLGEDIRTAAQKFRRELGSDGLQLIADQFVWRHERQQYWQTLRVETNDRQVVLRLVLLGEAVGIAGWGWDRPDRVPEVDSASAPRWVGSGDEDLGVRDMPGSDH